MILGLTGLKNSGKDTVGAYLVKEHEFQRRSYAEPLKKSFAALFDIPMWEIENWKNDDSVFVTVGNKNAPTRQDLEDFCDPPSNMWSPIRELTFREAIQRYGTESHRDIFGDDFWIDQVLPVGGYYKGRAIVVTDVRFENEAQRIRDLGGYIIKIINPSLVDKDRHRSETEPLGIKSHYNIVNNGSIEQLYSGVEKMLEVLEP